MFRDLGMLRDVFSSGEAALDSEGEKILQKFLSNLTKFPFAGLLEERLEKELGNVVASGNLELILNTLLGSDGLGYADIPKGLVPFHSYGEERKTAFFEHFKEALGYVTSCGTVSMHFTISPAFTERFTGEEKEAVSLLSSEGVSFDVTYSVQDPQTDTIAVTMDNVPVTDTDGSLLRRPAGHGALLKT